MQGGRAGIEPATSRTQSGNHTTRPTALKHTGSQKHARRDSNPQPPDSKFDALSIAPRAPQTSVRGAPLGFCPPNGAQPQLQSQGCQSQSINRNRNRKPNPITATETINLKIHQFLPKPQPQAYDRNRNLNFQNSFNIDRNRSHNRGYRSRNRGQMFQNLVFFRKYVHD